MMICIEIRIYNKHELQHELNQFSDCTYHQNRICCTLCTRELIVDVIICSTT